MSLSVGKLGCSFLVSHEPQTRARESPLPSIRRVRCGQCSCGSVKAAGRPTASTPLPRERALRLLRPRSRSGQPEPAVAHVRPSPAAWSGPEGEPARSLAVTPHGPPCRSKRAGRYPQATEVRRLVLVFTESTLAVLPRSAKVAVDAASGGSWSTRRPGQTAWSACPPATPTRA